MCRWHCCWEAEREKHIQKDIVFLSSTDALFFYVSRPYCIRVPRFPIWSEFPGLTPKMWSCTVPSKSPHAFWGKFESFGPILVTWVERENEKCVWSKLNSWSCRCHSTVLLASFWITQSQLILGLHFRMKWDANFRANVLWLKSLSTK